MLTRIITGVVGIAAAIAIITKGGVVFSGAVLLLALIGWHEYHKMAASKGYHVYPLTSGLGSLAIVGMAALGLYRDAGGLVHYFWCYRRSVASLPS